MADDKEFDIGIKVTADTSGADQTKQALAGVSDAAQDAGSGLRGAGEAAGEAEGGMGSLREAAVETGHGLHGVHMAIDDIARASQGGEGSVAAMALALRGIGMALGAGEFGGIGAAVGGVVMAISVLIEKAKAAEEEMKAIAEEAEKTKDAIDEVIQAAAGLKKPADDWKDSLGDARDALKETMALEDEHANSKLKLLNAQEKLALAQNEASDKSPEEKAKAKYDIETEYAGKRAAADQAHIAEQINTQKQAMQQEQDGYAKFQKAKDDAEEKYLLDLARKKAALEEKEPDMEQAKEDVGKKYGGYNLTHYGEASDLFDQRKAQYDADQAWLKANTTKDKDGKVSDAGDLAASQAAYTAAQKDFDEQAKKYGETYRAASQKLLELTDQAKTAAGVADLEQQTRDATEIGRNKEAQGKEADKQTKEEIERQKQLQEAIDAANKQQHDQQINDLEDQARLQEEIAHSPSSSQSDQAAALEKKKTIDEQLAALRNQDNPQGAAVERAIVDQKAADDLTKKAKDAQIKQLEDQLKEPEEQAKSMQAAGAGAGARGKGRGAGRGGENPELLAIKQQIEILRRQIEELRGGDGEGDGGDAGGTISDGAAFPSGQGFAPAEDVQAVQKAADALGQAKGKDDLRKGYSDLAKAVQNLLKHVLDLTTGQRDQDARLAAMAAALAQQTAQLNYNRP